MKASIIPILFLSLTANARHPGYTHYRFKIDAVGPSPHGGVDCVQMGELRFYDEHEQDITGSACGIGWGAKRSFPGEGPQHVFDIVCGEKAWTNKWCDESPSRGEMSNLWFRIDFPAPRRVMSYAWWTANDAISRCHWRDPVSWRVQGSEDMKTWTDLDVRVDYLVPTNRNFRVGPFGCPPPEECAVDAVDPFMGTGHDMMGRSGRGGMSHPGARVPFGLTQVVADAPWRDSVDYMFPDTTTEGFACTRLNGVGFYGDFGNFLVRPTVDLRDTFLDKAVSRFSRSRERAEPGYYATFLQRFKVFAEMTATARGAMMRFTYPDTDKADICIDLARRIALKSAWSRHGRQSARVVGRNRLEGEMFYSMLDGGWGKGRGKSQYRMFFVCELSQPLNDVLFYDGDRPQPGATEYAGSNVVFTARFRAKSAEPVLLKVAFSYTDLEGARRNFAADFPGTGFDFEGTRRRAMDAWRDALDVVTVKGGTPRDRAVFESCLFFAMQDPRIVADVDGRYRAGDKVYQSSDFAYRTVFSGWDVFRSEMPLLALIRPKDVSDTVNSLMATMDANNRKWLPVWDIFGCDSACMLGNPAIPTILDAYAEGIRTFDAERALAASRSTMAVRGNGTLGYTHASMSHTLEYAYDDWCVGRLAEHLGKMEVAREHYAKSLAYTNCWSKEVDWMRSRMKDGGWMPWKGLTEWWQGTAECNPYQQGWFVPHDPDGLIKLMGGKKRFAERLDEFMSLTPSRFEENLYYFHSNEPVHLVPFMFHFADRPDLTQKWTRRICADFYDIGSRGLCGPEDEGQMTAWYVLASIGLHPACPGAGVWMITSPVFDEVVIKLDPAYFKGGTFTIRARNNSPENVYVQRAALNGKPLDRAWLRYDEVTSGGVLELEMGPTVPNCTWHSPPNSLTE